MIMHSPPDTMGRASHTLVATKPSLDLFSIFLWLCAMLLVPGLAVEGLVFLVDTGLGTQTNADSIIVVSLKFLFASALLYGCVLKACPGHNLAFKFKYMKLVPSEADDMTFWGLMSLIFIVINCVLIWQVWPTPEPFMKDMEARLTTPVQMAVFAIVTCVVAPFIEEVFLRGWLHQALSDRLGSQWTTALLTSLVFTAIHAQYEFLITFASIFVFAVFLSWIRIKTENIVYCILAHALYNCGAVMLMLLV